MSHPTKKDLSRFSGCMLGLAIGDALGAPVEFMRIDEIRRQYGEQGVTGFERWGGFEAGSYSDDTQMSLSTADGLIRAKMAATGTSPCNPTPTVWNAYLEWYKTQSDPKERRAPGNTCLNALRSGQMGTVENPINDSKGCGGVMRIAPVGLAFEPLSAFQHGISFAAMTHGHPSGYFSAGFLAAIISFIVEGKNLMESVAESRAILARRFHCRETLEKVDSAVELAEGNSSVEEAIAILGQGWTGEEALAIAIFCSLRFIDDFGKAILTSVNHSGDSDSTGSIAGAIMGALLGEGAIPKEWIQEIEGRERLLEIAAELGTLFPRSTVSDRTEGEIEEFLKNLKS